MEADRSTQPPDDRVVAFLTAIVRFAYTRAHRTARFLGYLGTRAAVFSRATLYELGAILQIDAWERAGLRPYLPRDLPSSREALADLAHRVDNSTANGSPPARWPNLNERVFSTWLARCGGVAPPLAGGVFFMDGKIDNDKLESIADFVWRHRHLATKGDTP